MKGTNSIRWLGLGLLLLMPWAAGAQGLNAAMSKAESKGMKYLFVSLTNSTAVQASQSDLLFTSATFYGVKGVSATAAPTNNTASAYVGFKDATGASGVSADSPAFVEAITSGSFLGLGQTGTKYNLRDIYFLGSTGDKILILYTQ